LVPEDRREHREGAPDHRDYRLVPLDPEQQIDPAEHEHRALDLDRHPEQRKPHPTRLGTTTNRPKSRSIYAAASGSSRPEATSTSTIAALPNAAGGAKSSRAKGWTAPHPHRS